MKRGNPDRGSVVHYMAEDAKDPICKNGSFNIYYTDYEPQVNCPACKARLNEATD